MVGQMALQNTEQLVKQFLEQARTAGTAGEIEMASKPAWQQVTGMPANVVRTKPNLAAIWVWLRCRAVQSPHDGKRALAELQMNSPFFVGLSQAIDAMIAYNGGAVIGSLRTIRADTTIDPVLLNHMAARVELEAREIRDVTPMQTTVTVGAIYQGDVITGGTKIGSQVDNRQITDQSHNVDNRHIGDSVAGDKVGSQMQIQDSVISGSNVAAPTGPVAGSTAQAGPMSTPGAGGPAAAGKTPKFCPECGAKLGAPTKFCPECGAKIA